MAGNELAEAAKEALGRNIQFDNISSLIYSLPIIISLPNHKLGVKQNAF
jgi:hypothetical protein